MKTTIYLALGRPLCGVEKISFDSQREANIFIRGVELASGYEDLVASRHLSDVSNYILKTQCNMDKQAMLEELKN